MQKKSEVVQRLVSQKFPILLSRQLTQIAFVVAAALSFALSNSSDSLVFDRFVLL